MRKQNVKEQSAQKWNKPGRVLLECRAQDLYAQEFQNRLEKISRSARCFTARFGEKGWKDQQHQDGREYRHQHLVAHNKGTNMEQSMRKHLFHRINGGKQKLSHGVLVEIGADRT